MIAVKHNGATVCLIVDQVDGLHHVCGGKLEQPPPIFGNGHVSWLNYVTWTTDGEMVGVIDVDQILSPVTLADPAEMETAHV